MKGFFSLLALSSLARVTQALYFYLDGTTQKCFYEELPKDTLVVGHYTAEEYDDQRLAWWKHDGINIFITVDVRPHATSRRRTAVSRQPVLYSHHD